jgi:dihydroxyacetone kinase
VLGDERPVAARGLADCVHRAVEQVVALGKAEVGDKTILDAAVPFAEALGRAVHAGDPPAAAWRTAAAVAGSAAQGTAALRPRIGRARPLAERSVGTPDPGAVSFALCVDAAAKEMSDEH